jgi:hypothetical protein
MSNAEQCSAQLLTAKDVARELCVSQAWVRDHVTGRRSPALPVIRLGDRKAAGEKYPLYTTFISPFCVTRSAVRR